MSRTMQTMIGVWLALIPILLMATVYLSGITVNKSYEHEYNSCEQSLADAKALQKQTEDLRDVYCVKTFGRPSSSTYIFGGAWFVIGLAMYLFGLFGNNKRTKELDERTKELDARARLLEKMEKKMSRKTHGNKH